jgi:hypothetical protein
MPSSTPKQARFMAAVAHGFKPDDVKAPPVKVAQEFNQADKGGEMLHEGAELPRKKRSPQQTKAIVNRLRGSGPMPGTGSMSDTGSAVGSM